MLAVLGKLGCAAGGWKKRCYFGNLAQGLYGNDDLYQSLLSSLPSLDSTRGAPVADVQLCSNGCYAFVKFRDEQFASTAMKFHGLEIAGRPIKIGWPSGYVAPATGVDSLPVPDAVLRELGVPGVASNELFSGPLRAAGDADPAVVHVELETSASAGCTSDNRLFICDKFGFVELRDEDCAGLAFLLFNNVDPCGRAMRVGRPQGYVDAFGTVTGADPQFSMPQLGAVGVPGYPS
ncbi:hypothetical protein M885DRAFT_613798 [Pelagophyceae sp. CCMP2097]|nr:hypothetical protein M885DRAFT_613798 [Pelagophyceae sp. CCMP2097]